MRDSRRRAGLVGGRIVLVLRAAGPFGGGESGVHAAGLQAGGSRRARGGSEARSAGRLPLALSLSIWAQQLGEPGLFSAPTLTDVYGICSIST